MNKQEAQRICNMLGRGREARALYELWDVPSAGMLGDGPYSQDERNAVLAQKLREIADALEAEEASDA